MRSVIHARDGHDNNFHLMRHLAAIAVVLTHSYSVVTGRYASEPLVGWLGHSLGHYAVDVFFVLSGFVVTQSLLRDGDMLRFAVSRILRIFPALIVTVLLTAFILGPMVSTNGIADYFSDPSVWTYVAGSVSTVATDGHLPGVFAMSPEAGSVNAPLWTLKYELAAYGTLAALAAVHLVFGRRASLAAALAMLALFVAGRAVVPWPETESTASNALHLLLAFFLGAIGYVLRRRLPLTPLVAAALLGLTMLSGGTVANEVLSLVTMAYVLLWVGFLPAGVSQRLARTGDLSYGIYILAFPIQQLIYLALPEIQPLALFVLALCATLPAAWISWRFIEKPALDLRRPILAELRGLSTPRNQPA